MRFLGNPFFDGALKPSEPLAGAPQQRLGLLPGSRLPEALHNLELMLRVLERLPEGLRPAARLGLHAALVGKLTPQEVAPLASRLGWRLELDNPSQCRLVRGPLTLQLEWGRFAAVIQQCDLLLSMTGTAAEQCVGLGKPVLQLEGEGPQFTAGFAEAQRRLLGPGVLCAAAGGALLAATLSVVEASARYDNAGPFGVVDGASASAANAARQALLASAESGKTVTLAG